MQVMAPELCGRVVESDDFVGEVFCCIIGISGQQFRYRRETEGDARQTSGPSANPVGQEEKTAHAVPAQRPVPSHEIS